MTEDLRGERPMMGVFVYLLWGPLLWSLHLLLVYASHTGLCRMELADWHGLPLVQGIIIGVTVALAAAATALLIWPKTFFRAFVGSQPGADLDTFIMRTMRLLAVLSIGGILWSGMAAIVLPSCLQLR
ncbi:hypothetical protein FHS85_005002 [Rhodoligotrophos appendicifer]|uniref:hypothetical protein n=1 Tax=Rhodoligotrophos appendicifer TaxID=987056 RepID=UPI001186CEA2|nr:hypothetical protein [Rhodoligotrophos appendicifer]